MLCFYIRVLTLTWNDCLRELSAAMSDPALVIVINKQILNNTASAKLRTLFITLLVIVTKKRCFATKRIIIHKYYRI